MNRQRNHKKAYDNGEVAHAGSDDVVQNKAYIPLQRYQVEFKAASSLNVNEVQVDSHADDPAGDQNNADNPDDDQDLPDYDQDRPDDDDQDHPDDDQDHPNDDQDGPDDDKNDSDHPDDDDHREDKVNINIKIWQIRSINPHR